MINNFEKMREMVSDSTFLDNIQTSSMTKLLQSDNLIVRQGKVSLENKNPSKQSNIFIAYLNFGNGALNNLTTGVQIESSQIAHIFWLTMM